MRNVLLITFCLFASQPLFANDVGKCYPRMSDFKGAELKTYTTTWNFSRKPDTGGANVGTDKDVPKGRVVVSWRAEERSCIRCKGNRDVRVHFKNSGPLRIPRGVHIGVRFNKGCLTCQGASYTGNITCIHVSQEKWLEVFLKKYANCLED